MNYLHETELLGSAGAVKGRSLFFEDTFVVIGCDDLTDIGLLIAFSRRRKAIASIALVAGSVEQYGVVMIDEEGRIVGFQEKPEPGTERSRLVNTGVYVFDPAYSSASPPPSLRFWERKVFPKLAARQCRILRSCDARRILVRHRDARRVPARDA